MDSSFEPIRNSTTLTFKDHLSFEYWRIVRHAGLFIGLSFLAGIVLSPIVGPMIGPKRSSEGGVWETLWSTVEFAGVCLIVIVLVIGFRARKQWLATPALRGPIDYAFDEEGFHCTFGSQVFQMGWDKVVAVHERKRVIQIQTAQNLYFPCQRDAFSSAEDLARFRELVKRRVVDRLGT